MDSSTIEINGKKYIEESSIIKPSAIPVTLDLEKTVIDSLLLKFKQDGILTDWIKENLHEFDITLFNKDSDIENLEKDSLGRSYHEFLPFVENWIYTSLAGFQRGCRSGDHRCTFSCAYHVNYKTLNEISKGNANGVMVDTGENISCRELYTHTMMRDIKKLTGSFSGHNLYVLLTQANPYVNYVPNHELTILADDVNTGSVLNINSSFQATSALIIAKNKCTITKSENESNDTIICSPEIIGSEYLSKKCTILPSSWAKYLHAYAVKKFEQVWKICLYR